MLEHGDEFVGCADTPGGMGDKWRVDTSGRRAALLEGAMTSTIHHPNVVAVGAGFRAEGSGSEPRGPGRLWCW